jgi:hypothetical protein
MLAPTHELISGAALVVVAPDHSRLYQRGLTTETAQSIGPTTGCGSAWHHVLPFKLLLLVRGIAPRPALL